MLESAGQREEAQVLKGLEVMNPSGAEVALDALRSIVARSTDAIEAKNFALLALYRATHSGIRAAA